MRLARTCFELSAWMTGVLWLRQNWVKGSLAVLTYHRILPTAECRRYGLPSIVLPEDVFTRQLEWLTKHCDVLPVSVALEQMNHSARVRRPIVSITFDDGYADNLRAAAMLEDHGVRGTFFVTTRFVETAALLWFDRATLIWQNVPAEMRSSLISQVADTDATAGNDFNVGNWLEGLKPMAPADRNRLLESAGAHARPQVDAEAPESFAPMNQNALLELQARGHEIGAHSQTHPVLTALRDSELHDEVAGSKQRLEALLGQRVGGFCYPNGNFDSRVIDTVRRAGFSYACSTQPGVNRRTLNRWALKRVNMDQRHLVDRNGSAREIAFRAALCNLHGLLPSWRDQDGR